MTQNNDNNNSVSRRASNHSTKAEMEVPYVSNVDHNTITTEETSSVMNSEIGNQLNHMNQNTISSVSQNTHTMLSTKAQQCNNEDHIIPHPTYSNKGNRLMNNNKPNHNTEIYHSNRANTTGIQAYPTAQPSGSTDNNIHREYSDNSYYNNRQYSDDNSIDDMTITADMITESNRNLQRQLDYDTHISNASNDNTQRHYTQSIYIYQAPICLTQVLEPARWSALYFREKSRERTLRSLLPGSRPQGMSRYPHHSLADGQLGLGTEVIRSSRKD